MNLPRFGDFAIKPLTDTNLTNFSCDKGLEEFFKRHAHDTETELIAKTYFLCHDKISEPLVGFSLSFASIKATTEINMMLPKNIQYKSYPALLIGRFATHTNHLKKGVRQNCLESYQGVVCSAKSGRLSIYCRTCAKRCHTLLYSKLL